MRKIFVFIVFVLLFLSACNSDKYEVITHFDTGFIDTYPVPKPGEKIVYSAVKYACEYYEKDNVKFLVYFDFYDESGEKNAISFYDTMKEYERLYSCGYDLYQGKVWTYKNRGEKKYFDAIFLLLSKEEIESFRMNENYGYSFMFIHNGDYSSVNFKDCKKMKLSDLDTELLENKIASGLENYYKKIEPFNSGRLYVKLVKPLRDKYLVLSEKYNGEGHHISDLFVIDKDCNPLYKASNVFPMSSCFSVVQFNYDNKTVLFGSFNDTKWLPEKDIKVPVEIDNIYVKLKSGEELREKIDYKDGCILILNGESLVETFEIYNKKNKLQAKSDELYPIEFAELIRIE